MNNVNEKTCLRCGHKWLSLHERPKVCPRCKSYQWDKPPRERLAARQQEGRG